MKHILTFLLLTASISSYSQKTSVQSDVNLTETDKKEIIDSLTKRLEEFYIRPDSIQKIKTKLGENFNNGNYQNSSNPNEFASKLTADLIEVSKDLHFSVIYSPQWVDDQQKSKDVLLQKEIKAKELIESKKKNFGFQQTRILEGNVGYLEFTYFHDPVEASEIATTAMQFLSNTDALIIDLRKNNGGVMEMGQFLSSYLFYGKDLPLYNYYYYESGRKKMDRAMWLLPSVPGKRLDEMDIYILTSGITFSAAEWMSYSLQNLKRVTIVGEQTAGGAHPIDRKIVAKGFSVNIPFGEVKDPVTNSDFEGRGVTPDVPCKSEDAVNTAHLLALERLSLKSTDSLNTIDWIIPLIKSRQKPVSVAGKVLKSYEGKYGKGQLVYENAGLYFKWNNTVSFLLTPLQQDLFLVNGIDDFRIKILFEKNAVSGIKRIYQDGHEKIYPKE